MPHNKVYRPRFADHYSYVLILKFMREGLVNITKLPVDLVRPMLISVRNKFLDDLERELNRVVNIHLTDTSPKLERRIARNRALSMKAMIILIKLTIDNNCVIRTPPDSKTPSSTEDIRVLPFIFLQNKFRILYVKPVPRWFELCDPECKFIILGNGVGALEPEP